MLLFLYSKVFHETKLENTDNDYFKYILNRVLWQLLPTFFTGLTNSSFYPYLIKKLKLTQRGDIFIENDLFNNSYISAREL